MAAGDNPLNLGDDTFLYILTLLRPQDVPISHHPKGLRCPGEIHGGQNDMANGPVKSLPLLIFSGILHGSHEKYDGDGNAQCQHDTGG